MPTVQSNRKIIYLAGFLFALPIALTSYINSSFLGSFINEDYVGIIYVIASIFTIWSLLEMPKILTRFGNRKTALYASLATFISLIVLGISKNEVTAIPAFIIFFISGNIIAASLDIFIEDFSKSSNIGKLRGFYLMIINTAWVISQTISGSIIAKSSFKGIYIFSAIFMLFVSVVFFFFLKNFLDPKYKKVSIKNTIKYFWQNKNVSKIYLINFILKFFFSWMIIYTPIYLHEHLGFDWSQIGIIFAIMLIPFVLLDVPLGKLSDKIGEKKMLLVGFALSAFFTLMIPLVDKTELLIWAGILFGTRIGAATLEIMSESYFFKEVGAENADAISFFRNALPLSYIVAPLLAVPILLFIPSFKFLFFILGAIMLFGFLITLRLRDVK